MPDNIAPVVNGVVKPDEFGIGAGEFVLQFATLADEIPPWGTAPRFRDQKLREFWPTEPILASAMFSTTSRYVAFGSRFEGPDRMVRITEKMWQNVEWGQGPEVFLTKVLTDMLSQDNGAFFEIVRTSDSPTAPVVTLKHLDSNRCVRTGRPMEPIIYIDSHGINHTLKWYQVISLVEFPSPVERMRGMGLCAVSRLLRAAQIIRDIATYEHEKISGRFHRSIWLVGGVTTRAIQDAMTTHQMQASSEGLIRYIQPLILGTLDPTKTVSAERIDLASMPDHFDKEAAMRWYVNQLALAFGADYQDFAPLPGGNLGTAQQSEILHIKSKGKGPRLFMKLMEHVMNYRGILPDSVKFQYGDQDIAEDMQHSRMNMNRANMIETLIKSGLIDDAVGRQLLHDAGILKAEYLEQLGNRDLHPAHAPGVSGEH